jgi:transposase
MRRLDLENLPNDVGLLHHPVRDMAAQMETDQTRLAEAEAEVAKLHLLINKFQRMQYGRRSERLDPDQFALGLEDLDGDVARVEEHIRRQLRGRSNRMTDRLAGARRCPIICRARR